MMNEQHKRQKNNTQITSIYHLYEKKGKLRMGNQMVRAIPNGKLQKK